MNHSDIMRDVQALAGRLLHRKPNSENEREAAEYLRQRMRTFAPDALCDPFDSIDSWGLLNAAYYGEFLIVSLIAMAHPLAGLGYGALVFVLYLADFTGYHVLTRFLPHYASQNVMGRILALRPRRFVVVTAHYDSGAASMLSRARVAHRLRLIHIGVVLLMVTVLGTCAIEALAAPGADPTLAIRVRWGAALILAAAGLFLLLNERSGEHARGAVDNASGVAAMLALARRLHEDPLESTEVVFLATGSSTGGFNGIHHFVRHHELDRHHTYFLNFDQVGAGRLVYTRGEGMLHVFRSSQTWLAHARSLASASFDIEPATLTMVPSEMIVPLARGYKCLSIMGLDQSGVPAYWHSLDDSIARVDAAQIERAAAFGEALIRALDAT